MRAKLYPVFTITLREFRDQFRDWRIIFPIMVMTLIFPGIAYFLSDRAMSFISEYGGEVVGERLLPFLMLIVGFFPVSISLSVALDSFVGEKERRSIEPLLSTPLADWQLYLGKLLASLILPISVSYLGTAVFLLGIYRSVGWLPTVNLLIITVALVAVQTLVMVSGAVVVSTQTTSTRAANLLSSFIVLPMALLIQGESVVIFWGDENILWWAVLGQILLAGLLIRMGVAHFNREDLLGRELDTLNLGWAGSVFRRAFVGQAHSLREWLSLELRPTLRKIALPTLLTLFLFMGGVLLGSQLSKLLPVMDNIGTNAMMRKRIAESLQNLPFSTLASVPVLWYHNVRALVLATLMGVVSFSVAGMLVLMLPSVVVGLIFSKATEMGFSPWELMMAFVIPHGIFEIPALLMMGGAILRLGASLVAPVKDKSIGEAWLAALADWAKIMVAIVIPLMLGAALVEALITPRIAMMIFGQ